MIGGSSIGVIMILSGGSVARTSLENGLVSRTRAGIVGGVVIRAWRAVLAGKWGGNSNNQNNDEKNL